MNMGDLERCRKELDSVIQMVPKSNDARFQHARLNYLEKRYNDAEQDYEMLRKSKDTRGMAGIIDCKIAEHKGSDAIQMIKDELAQQPNDLLLQYTLASLEYSLGRYSESAKDYQILLAKNSSRPAQDRETWYLRMGEAQRFAGDVGSATASFQKAHEIAPKDSMPTLEQAMMLDTSGHPAEARKLYEDVLKIEPDNTVALNNLAYAKANDGVDLDQALTYAQRARTKSPSDLNVMDTLGLIYLRKNLTDDSLRMLQELVGKVPDSATFHLHYAMALYQKGNKPEAKKELDLALHHKPSDQESQQIKELMQKIG
jgi:Flp pilus assembly protein TadD